MKQLKLILFLILGILVLMIVVFNIPSRKEVAREEPLSQAERDSIDAAIAYANRPWQLGEFVDDFGDRTGDKFIGTTIDGTFSNSATSNSYLHVRLLVTKDNAGIFLHEYERSGPPQKFIGSGTVMLRNSNNETISLRSTRTWNDSGGILIINGFVRSNFTELRDFLMKSVGEVRVVIRNEYSSVYNFTVDATGFTAEYNLL